MERSPFEMDRNGNNFGGAPASYSSRRNEPNVLVLAILRFIQFLLCLIAFSIMVASSTGDDNFATFYAFSFIVGISIIVAFFSFGQFVACIVKICRIHQVWGDTVFLVQIISDYVLGMLLFGASSAGASQSSQNRKTGFDYCGAQESNGYGTSFCNQTAASVALTFLASFCLIATFWINVTTWLRKI